MYLITRSVIKDFHFRDNDFFGYEDSSVWGRNLKAGKVFLRGRNPPHIPVYGIEGCFCKKTKTNSNKYDNAAFCICMDRT